MSKQIERIMSLDQSLQEGRPLRLEDAAYRYGVDRRTLKRDINFIKKKLGAPVSYDRFAQSYKYERPFKIFDHRDERLLMLFCLVRGLVDNPSQVPFFTDTIVAYIKKQLPKDYQSLAERVRYDNPVSETLDYDTFHTICLAIIRNCKLNFTYTNARGEPSTRLVEAERLINYGGRWYLVAWDNTAHALRTFHLSRFSSASLGGAIETQGPERTKLVADFLSAGFGLWRSDETNTVTIRLYGSVAPRIARQTWHPAQADKFLEHEGEEKILERSFPVSGYEEILSRVLSFGASAEVVGPPDFRELWVKEVRKMLKLVGEG